MPTDEQLKRKIAEVLGWKAFHRTVGIATIWVMPDGDKVFLPDWPTDRNASYELMKDFTGMESGLYLGSAQSAREESLGFLDREGWRWAKCTAKCGDGKCPVCFGDGQSHGGPDRPGICLSCDGTGKCPACTGEGGKWEKIKL